jgi:hypothetical protein
MKILDPTGIKSVMYNVNGFDYLEMSGGGWRLISE